VPDERKYWVRVALDRMLSIKADAPAARN
jgi:hypothetical protein